MAELTVMKYNQMMMAILGVTPYSFTSPSLNWLRSLNPFLIISTLFACASLAALYAYQETRLSLMLEAVVLLMGATSSLFAYLNMVCKMDSVGEMNSSLQKMVDQGR